MKTTLSSRISCFVVLLAVTLLFSIQASSQTWTFRNGFGQNGATNGLADFGRAVCTDASGNVYITGKISDDLTANTVSFGGAALVSAGDDDGFVAKFNSAGVHQWSIRFGSSGTDEGGFGIATDGTSVYVVGEANGIITVGTSATTYPPTAAGLIDGIVMKLDAATGATVSWVTRFGGNNSDRGQAICLDPSGNIYISGNFRTKLANPTATFGSFSATVQGNTTGYTSDLFAAALNSSGTFLWVSTGGAAGVNDNINGSGICYVPSSAEVIVTGSFRSAATTTATYSTTTPVSSVNLTHSTTSGVSVNNEDFCLLEINAANGAFVSGSGVGAATGNEAGLGITYDASTTDVYFAGYFSSSSTTFPGNPANTNPAAATDNILYGRYNPSTNAYMWVKDADNGTSASAADVARAIASNATGSIFIAGNFRNTVTFPGGAALSASGTQSDVFVAKIDPSTGNATSATQGVGTSAIADDIAYGIATASGGNAWITGQYASSITFAPLAALASQGGKEDILLAKFNDPPPAFVTSVTVPPNSTYGIGTQLNFTVNWSEAVNVTGSPFISITIGASVKNAVYISGSGTTALLFRYIVSCGDFDNDGITVGTLNLNGGTIKNTAAPTVNANITLNNVGSTAAVNVSAAAPVVNAPTVTQPTCATPTGTIVVNATGNGTLEYSINNGGSYQSSGTFGSLAPGNYDIVVRFTGTTCATSYSGNQIVLNTATGCSTLSINDVTQNELNSGSSIFSFTVSLSAPAGAGGVTFDIATADNSATIANNDYVQKSLTSQTIPEGGSTYTFDVTVNGDNTVEPDETFFINVTNVTGATVSDGQGQGTITDDDTPPFTDISAVLTGVYGSAVWGDYDNDGDLDILLSGVSNGSGNVGSSLVYRNDGGGVFTDINAGLAGVTSSSVAWGDYDNDGDLDILLTGSTNGSTAGAISKVYRNDGGTFTDIAAGLIGVYLSSVAWGDYDNDGDLDILLTGRDVGNSQISKVYRNDSGIFADIVAGLTGVQWSSVAWGDYDNDGDLDVLLAGYDAASNYISKTYRNTAGIFTDINAGLVGVLQGSVAWGDYDNDGDLDILLTGNLSSGRTAKVYRNDNGTFTEINAGLPGVSSSSAAWGDYNNDGNLDIVLSGFDGAGRISKVYRNNGNGTFSDINAGLTAVAAGSVAWGDYDNDGDLDILLTGLTQASARLSIVYRNNATTPNTVPTAPTGLTATPLSGNRVTLQWSAASDNQAPAAGLSYNLRVGTTPGAGNIVGPMANTANGYRRVPKFGPQQTVQETLTLPPGHYYWSVQAIDAALTGGPFAIEAEFTVAPLSVITTTGTLTPFTACAGTASAEQTFTVAGSNLTNNLTVAAPAGFEVSTTTGTGFGTSISPLVPSGGTVNTTTIYVRMAATATGTPSGNIACASTGASTQNVAVSGTVNPIPSTPTITPGGPTTFCAGGSVTLTSSSATGNQWYLNNNPIGGATNQTYIATASGSYTVMVTTSGCSSLPSSGIVVTVNPIPPTPTITPGGPTTFCSGGSVTLTSSSATGNQWYLNGNPIGGATNQTYIATASGSYTTIVTTSGCSSLPSSGIVVTVNPLPPTPTITPGGPTTFCAGGSVTLTSSSATGNQWYLNNNPIGGATNQTYIATASGSYTVMVTTSGCSSLPSSGIVVTVNPIPPTPTITPGGPTTFCSGGSVTLTSSSATGNQWYLNGNPIGGATNQTYIATASGSNTTIVTTSGCSSLPSTGIVVTVSPLPALTINTPTVVQPTCAMPTGTITVSASGGGGSQLEYSVDNGVTWQFNPTFNSLAFSSLAPGSYFVRARIQGGSCSVSYSGNPVVLGLPSCPGKTIPGRIEAESFDAKNGPQYGIPTDDPQGGVQHVIGITNGSWMDYNVLVTQAGLYTVTFRVATTQNNPQFQIKLGTTVLGIVNITNTGGWSNWQNVSVSNIALTAGSKTIRIQSTSNESCNFNWTDWAVAGANTAPSANAGPNQSIVQPASSVNLAGSGIANNGGSITSHVWSKFSGGPATIFDMNAYNTPVTGLTVGTYVFRLTVTQDDNQTATSDVTVVVNPSSGKFIPGRVEAESFDARSGPQYAVPTSDVGGGQHVIGLSNGSWLDYNVNVTQTGAYTVNFRVATTQNNPQFQIKSGATVLATVNIPNTGGWDTWMTVPVTNVALTAGTQTIRIQLITNESCNFNWMDWSLTGPNTAPTVNAGPNQVITLPTNQVTMAGSGSANNSGGFILSHVWTKFSGGAATITDLNNYGTTITGLAAGTYVFRLTVTQNDNQTATSDVTITVNGGGGGPPGKVIPGKIEAEAWDAKLGPQYAVPTSDAGGGQQVIGMTNGSWLDYNVTVNQTGTYTVNFRVATTQNNAQFQVKLGATVLGTINIPNTGGWDTWQTVALNNVSLTAGLKTIRIQSSSNESCNFNWMDWLFVSPPVAPVTMINISPDVIPTLQKEKVTDMSVSVFPNPAEAYFNLKVQTKSMELITIRIVDIAGRQVEQLQSMPGQTIRFGDKIMNGTYLVEVSQGSERIVTKVVKQ